MGNVGHEALDGIVRGNVEAVRGPFVVKTFLGLKLIPVLEKALTPARLGDVVAVEEVVGLGL